MKKKSNEILNNFWVNQLLPIVIFTSVVLGSSFVVTACGPTRASALKDGPGAANQVVAPAKESLGSSSLSTADLQLKLAGTWNCSIPKDATLPCSGQSIQFTPALDKVTLFTRVPLNSGNGQKIDQNTQGCRVQIDYTSSVQISASGEINFKLNQASLGKLIDDPSDSALCSNLSQDKFDFSDTLNSSTQEKLTHSADWSQITFEGVTYSKTGVATAETWIDP